MKGIGCISFAVPLLLLFGCSSAGQQDLETAKDKIRRLQQEAAESDRRVEELERRIENLEGQRDGSLSATATPLAETSPAVPPTDVGPLTRIEIDETDLDAPPSSSAAKMSSAGGAATADRGTGTAVTAEAQALYDQGYTFFHQGRYLDAETTFQQFLQSHGSTDLGDNAQYWIGECRWGRSDYRGALDAFRETVERYPDGNKVPDALLKVGQSLEELSDSAGARLAYEEVMRRYPDSRAAVVAGDRQAELR